MKQPIAFIFPGQGSQYVGMGQELFRESAAARAVFAAADAALDFSVSDSCFNGPAEQLTRSSVCQPAIVTTSAAVLAAVREVMAAPPQPAVCAGLSLGEYSALLACGSVALADALRLVRQRGILMDEASRIAPGTMVSLLGIDEQTADRLCRACGAHIANLNCPGQVVISGSHEAVRRLTAAASEQGVKRVIPLDVSGAFHSSLMDSAAAGLREALATVPIQAPTTLFIPNVTAEPENNPERIRSLLVEQLTRTTYWEKSVRLMIARGVREFWELGPGAVMGGIVRRIDKTVKVISLQQYADIQALASCPA